MDLLALSEGVSVSSVDPHSPIPGIAHPLLDAAQASEIGIDHQPLRLVWERRTVREPFAGQQRIVVPLSGGPPPAGSGRDLTYLLDWMWVRRPAEQDPFAMTSVVCVIARDPESLGAIPSHSLLLLVATDGLPFGQQLDTPEMAADLEAALAALQSVAQ